MSATIKDVAQYAGVSVATASRALTGHPNVSAQARARVEAAVLALDYQPDQVARSLRKRRTNLIGLVISTIENVFFTELARAAEQTAHAHNYNLIVCNTEEDIEQEQAYLSLLDRQLVAGIILAPAPGDGQHLQSFIESHLPIVLINRLFEHLPLPSITCNDTESSRKCVTQLIQEGHTRIAVITGLPNISTTQQRLHGYLQALNDAGLAIDPGLQIDGKATLEGGYYAMQELLTRPERPHAVFIFNNVMTQGAVMAVQDAGLHWPDDLDIAGFGAFRSAGLYRPPLTLIAQPTHEMGKQAVLTLIQQINDSTSNGVDRSQVLQNTLILRAAWTTQRLLDARATTSAHPVLINDERRERSLHDDTPTDLRPE